MRSTYRRAYYRGPRPRRNYLRKWGGAGRSQNWARSKRRKYWKSAGGHKHSIYGYKKYNSRPSRTSAKRTLINEATGDQILISGPEWKFLHTSASLIAKVHGADYKTLTTSTAKAEYRKCIKEEMMKMHKNGAYAKYQLQAKANKIKALVHAGVDMKKSTSADGNHAGGGIMDAIKASGVKKRARHEGMNILHTMEHMAKGAVQAQTGVTL